MSPADIQLLEIGDILWEVRRQKLGNTKMMGDAVFAVRVKEIARDDQGAIRVVSCSWNSNQARAYFLGDLQKLRTCYPVLGRNSVARRSDQTLDGYNSRVAADQQHNAEDKKRWQKRRKDARLKAVQTKEATPMAIDQVEVDDGCDILAEDVDGEEWERYGSYSGWGDGAGYGSGSGFSAGVGYGGGNGDGDGNGYGGGDLYDYRARKP